ncbi:MAG: NAD(P)/FAD-dependent oxidoreductase [Desulfobulbaceae bacterium]|nr:NAD(P)/FAD-dependent oxidoreductase [Desulfobulbaceae bacterium]
MDYDAFVIGAGTAGTTAAFKLKANGFKVGIVDNRPLGGTCALRGCNPKKILWGFADLAAKTGALNAITDARIEWADLITFKRTFTDPVPGWTEEMLKDEGIDVYRKKAKFTGRQALEIDGKTVSAGKIVIASGATPRKLGIAGEEFVTLSDAFLDLADLPQTILFIGGGYISLEFANMVNAWGRKAIIFHSGPAILKGFEPDIVDLLMKGMKKRGIDVFTESPVTGVRQEGKKLVVEAGDKEVGCDLAVHGAGRVPDIEEIDLKAGNVDADAKGILVNEYLQSTTNKDVYAAGDAAGVGLPLTPTASMHGVIVAENITEGNTRKVNHFATPSVVFSIPPLASVGMTEKQARDKSLDFRVNFTENTDGFDSRRLGLKSSGYKVLIDNKGGGILGAHLHGENADEAINIFALAMREKIPADNLAKVLWTFPTTISDIEDMVK